MSAGKHRAGASIHINYVLWVHRVFSISSGVFETGDQSSYGELTCVEFSVWRAHLHDTLAEM